VNGDASMTTFLLTPWAHGRKRGPRLTLETTVRRLTSDPATRYGFDDRGVVPPGMKADLDLLDLQDLGMMRPEQICDLPGRAGRLVQRAECNRATFVGGVQVVSDDEVTGELPGTQVRRLTA